MPNAQEVADRALARVAELEAQIAINVARNRIPNDNADAARIEHYRVPKLASFMRADPNLWFLQAEISMRNARISAEATMADTVLATFDLEVLGSVKDIIAAVPPHPDVYQRVKARVISTFSVSDEAKLRQLLKGQVLTDGKPSLILSRLRNLNTGNIDPAIVRSVFMDQLPPAHRAILFATGADDLDKLAEAADRLADCSGSFNAHVAAMDNRPRISPSLEDDMKQIIRELANVNKRLDKIERSTHGGRSASRGRSVSRSRANSKHRSVDGKQLCYAHRKYPDNPTSCTDWCSKRESWTPVSKN